MRNIDKQNISNIVGIDELNELMSNYNIKKDDVCLTGSTCLAIRNIRQNGDLDIVLKWPLEEKIDAEQYDHISIHRRGQYARMCIFNDDLIENSQYHDLVDGFKIIRPEIYYSYKKMHMANKKNQRKKDVQDMNSFEKHIIDSDEWDESLVVDNPRPFILHFPLWMIDTVRKKGLWYTFRYGSLSFIKNHIQN